MKRKILGTIEIAVTLIMIILLLFNNISKNAYYFIMITVFIGWAIPYMMTLLSAIAIIKDSHHKLTIVSSILNIFLICCLFFFIHKLYDKDFIIFIIEYIIILIISIINTVYLVFYFKTHPNLENEQIKKIKKKNNGAIV